MRDCPLVSVIPGLLAQPGHRERGYNNTPAITADRDPNVMNDRLLCYQCGASLDALSLPFSRYDECPECSRALRVCRMCEFYDARVPQMCTEDGAEEIREKEHVNFCEWFKPGSNVFDGKHNIELADAKSRLDALFGDGDTSDSAKSAAATNAEDLFK